jgi:hypothetical protein
LLDVKTHVVDGDEIAELLREMVYFDGFHG